MGQAFVLLNPKTLVMLQLEVDQKRFDQTRKVFEAVVNSLDARDPAELDKQRAQQIENGKALLESITPQAMHKAIKPEQLQFGIGKDSIRSIDDPLFVSPDDPRLLKLISPSPRATS